MITPAMFTTAVERAVTATAMVVSDDIELIDDYSGRGMEGRTCIGVAVSSLGSTITLFAMNLALELRAMTGDQNADEMDAVFKGIEFDDLGLGMVIYFPQWEYTGDEMQEGLSKW